MIGSPAGYLGLFFAAFLAATLLPAQSELGLVALNATGAFSLVGLVVVASLGNTLGAVLNWWLGHFAVARLGDKKWFPISSDQLERAGRWYGRWGRWSLLLSWMPIIGDPLTFAAGVMREPFWRFLIIVGFAKTARYAVLAYIFT